MGELLTSAAQISPRRLSTRLKVTLDAVRALAAVYVVVHHVVVNSSLSGPITYLFRFGQEAVIVFFLLSGFLIFASEQSRVRTDLRGYYLRRVRRIYPLLGIAMLVTAGVVMLNRAATEFNWWQLVANILSLQDVSALKPGVIADPFMGNSPLWSLSYEVFFYAVFPLVMIARRASHGRALAVVGSLSIVGYATFLLAPNHFSLVTAYLLVWWAGAVIADLYRADRLTFRGLLPVTGWLAALCLVAALGVVAYGRSDIGVFPMLPLRHFAFALVCVALSASMLAHVVVRIAQPVAHPAAYLSSMSYGLYVLHYPLLVQWDMAQDAGGFVGAIIILILGSILCDRWLDRELKGVKALG